jgi:DNA-binding PadR family transcriptional regulator
VTAQWRTTAGGRRRKYYALTDQGRAALREQRRQWSTVTRTLDGAWRPLRSDPAAGQA